MVPERYNLNAVWEFRWRFDYADKPSKFGSWMDRAEDASAKAVFQDKNGMIYARIEARRIGQPERKIVAECSHQDYRLFQWVVGSKLNYKQGKISSGGSTLIGICLWSRYSKTTAFVDGSVKVEELPIEDQNFNFESYGR